MSKLLIITPEKVKDKALISLQDYYRKIIKPHTSLEFIHTGSVKINQHQDAEIEKALSKEADLMLKKITTDDFVILLTEKGKTLDTQEFSKQYNNSLDTSRRTVFIIGSALGIHPKLFNIANLQLALSKMTFTHEMALVILMEQLYRVTTIKIGKRYHY